MTASRTLLVLLVLVAYANPATAQNPTHGIHITPWVGAFVPSASGSDLPFVDESGVVDAHMTSSPALGADVEWRLPVRSLSIRGGVGLAVFTSVEFENWDGDFMRGNTHVSLGNPQGTGSSVMLLTGTAVFRPLPGDRLPYLMGGVGLKRHNFLNIGGELEEALSGDRTAFSFHLGLGLLIGRRIRIEISDHISRQSFSFEVPQLDGVPGRTHTQNDFVVALGYRFGPR